LEGLALFGPRPDEVAGIQPGGDRVARAGDRGEHGDLFADYTYLLRPMPVDDPEGLVAVFVNAPNWGGLIAGFSIPEVLDYRKQDTGLAEIMGSTGIPLSVTDGQKPQLIWGEMVTGNFFSGLGVHPVVGRGFLPTKIARLVKTGVRCELQLLAKTFQSDSNIAGKTIKINEHPFTIVGVAPRGFIGTTLFQFVPDVWLR